MHCCTNLGITMLTQFLSHKAHSFWTVVQQMGHLYLQNDTRETLSKIIYKKFISLRLDVIPKPIWSKNNKLAIFEICLVNIWRCRHPITIELYSAQRKEISLSLSLSLMSKKEVYLLEEYHITNPKTSLIHHIKNFPSTLSLVALMNQRYQVSSTKKRSAL